MLRRTGGGNGLGGATDINSGGSYGGTGGGPGSGPTYGSVLTPTDLGSAGGADSGGTNAGGGAIRLVVSGTLTNNGVISANGLVFATGNSGGGAGGSIWATVGTLAGSGSFTANGSVGTPFRYTGGGGRIAIYFQTNSGFDLRQVTANAGPVNPGYSNYMGTAGTVYTLGGGGGNGTLTVSDNLVLPDASVVELSTLTINNGGTLSVGNDSTIIATIVTMSAGSTFKIGGGSTLTTDSLQIAGNSTLLLEGKNTSGRVNGAWAGVGVTVYAGSIQIDAGSKISADGQGYVSKTGSGNGPGGAANSSSGGSYGGNGGGTGGRPTYGSSLTPTDLGSAGGEDAGASNAGGGAIRLIVSGTLTNNGVISANGAYSTTSGNTAGGAGGSIWATMGTLAGNGSFTANGSRGTDFRYTGGGGRIAVYFVTNNGFDLTKITADAGYVSNSSYMGTAGSVVDGNTAQFLWIEPTQNVLHDTVTLRWAALAVDQATTTVDITALSNGTASPVATNLPCFSSTDWDSTAVPDGRYELRLTFRDGSGNTFGEVAFSAAVNNSMAWHSGTLAGSEEWTTAKVQGIDGTVVVPSGVTLTIEPGTIIKALRGASIFVQDGGILNTAGTDPNHVVFTAIDDSSVGGDSTFGGGQSLPVPGAWNGVSAEGTGQLITNNDTEFRYLLRFAGGTLSGNQTWPGNALYRVTDNLVIPNGVTLTIEPGAIVKFDGARGITVQAGGALVANGTVAQPIYLTSVRDDSVGGDTNGDGGTSTPAMGDWDSIYIASGATASFNHATIRYGNGYSNAYGVLTTYGTLTVSNSVISDIFYDGIWSGGGTATIISSIITETNRAVNEHGGTVQVTNCTIDNNTYGIWGSGSHLTVVNSIVTNSAIKGFNAGAAPVSYSDVWNPHATGGNGTYVGVGNISVDPKFRNLALKDYRLNYGSPAIDSADGAHAPVTDYMGAPRYDDPRTANTGTATSTGAYADMGAYEFVEDADSDIDLVAEVVSGPTSAIVGNQVQISWTDTNIGQGLAVGPWHDAIYLVRDPDTNPVRILAGEVTVGLNKTIGFGQSIDAVATVSVPGTIVGNHRWEVKTNSRGEVFEGKNSGNNAGLSAAVVAVDLNELKVDGQMLSGQFSAVGQSFWYKMIPGPGKDVTLNLNLSGNTGTTQLYMGRGYLPDAQDFDFRQNEWNSANTSTTIPGTSSQTYYVTAYAASLSAGSADFSISAKTVNFSVTAVQPGSVFNDGDVTLELTGDQLDAGAVYELVGPEGTVYDAENVFWVNSSKVFVNFNMNGLAAGSYSIVVIENGNTVTVPNAVNFIPGVSGLSQIEYDLIVPEAVRAGGQGTVIVTYKNIGNTDAIAPLMWLDASRKATLQEIVRSRKLGFNRVSLYSTGIVLGINQEGPAGILPPGASGSVTFDMKPTETSGEIDFTLRRIADPRAALDWDGLRLSTKPGFMDPNAWKAVFANAEASIGDSLGQFNAALAADATYLSRLGIYEQNAGALLTFELLKAGLATIVPRYASGAFGLGTSHPFDIWGDVEDGNIILRYPVGRVRILMPDETTEGQFNGVFRRQLHARGERHGSVLDAHREGRDVVSLQA